MGKSWDEIDLSTVKTGDIKNAEFTINKYTVNDGAVEEKEENVPIGEEEMDEIRKEVNESVTQALDEFDETGEVSSFDVDLEGTGDVEAASDAETAAQSDSDSGTTEESSEEETEQSEPKDPDAGGFETAKAVAEEYDITKHDWPTFAKQMRERGFNDQSQQSDLWGRLKDEGIIESAEDEQQSESESAEDESDSEPEAINGDAAAELDEFGIPAGMDILMVQTDETASEMVVSALSDAIDAEEVIAMPITSDVGEKIIEPLPSDVTTPFYVEATEEGLVKRDLEELTGEYI